MVEYYDLKVDPYELHNKHEDGDPTKMVMLKKRLGEFMECWGDQCFDPPEHPEPLPPPHHRLVSMLRWCSRIFA